MKILIIQEKSRHSENINFRESLNLSRALNSIGCESIVWGLNYDNFNIPFDTISKDCDAVVLLENYEIDNWVPSLDNYKGLKLFWSVDSHCALEPHIHTCKKHKIDVVLNSVYGHGKYFNTKSYFFPNAYPDDIIFPKKEIEKTYDVGFCGNWNNRKNWIDFIESNGIIVKKDIFVIGDNMVNAINSYKIHFNRNISDDINYRTFETLGCNTFLLTNKTPGIYELFTEGENIVTYDNEFDLMDKINFYLKNTNERERLTKNGFEHVKKNHTYKNRASHLIKILEECL